MPADRQKFRLRNYLAVALVGMLLLGGSAVWGINVAIDRAVSADARARAQDWARYFIETLPDLDALVAGGMLDNRQAQVVATAAKVGNVFRFTLYDPKGNTVLESDAAQFGKDEDAEHIDADAREIVTSKRPMVALNDGRNERNMPALYAEAYVPVLWTTGGLRAIVETYVDETQTAQFFKTSFTALAGALGLGMALAFGLPTLAFLLRTRQNREVSHHVEYLASHDPMTSLLNRGAFTRALAARIAAHNGEGRLAVIYLDVDDFKAINDSHGHEAGDDFLKRVARCLAGVCGEGDLVARAAGDEFILALTRPTEAEIVATLEAILESVREPLSVNGRLVPGRLSAGLYVIKSPDKDVEEAMRHADTALYQAKIDGKNRLCQFTDEMEGRMRARRRLERLVQTGLAEQRFEVHYQPLLAAASKRCIGFEALLRLKDDAGAYVPPMHFIPIAEQLGLIDAIGQWVLEQATRAAALWPDPMFVSVNLSVRQFADGTLVDIVSAALAAAGLPARRLELEVTETLLMENSERVAPQFKALKALGVSTAMDDFGTGYSSLGYLWQFGFDKLKIDRSFVAALDVDPKKAREILETIVMLAHRLDMTVTAEGIETEAQALVLDTLGCDQLQGYFYGRPGPADAIAPLLLRAAMPRETVAAEQPQAYARTG